MDSLKQGATSKSWLLIIIGLSSSLLIACGKSPSLLLANSGSNPPINDPDTNPTLTLLAFADEMNSCVLREGNLVCWGENGQYQKLDGTTDHALSPVLLSGLPSPVTSFDAGFNFICVVANGGVKCWGSNEFGQLGDGTTVAKDTPVDVIGLTSGVLKVVAGWKHACALLADGGVKCWGENTSGELGRGFTDGAGGFRATPDYVSGLTTGASDIASGSAKAEHTCAIVDGGALCWGYNSSGVLGDGTKTSKSVPTLVNGIGAPGSGVLKIAPSRYSTCALLTGNVVNCWGDNDYGQLGNNSATTNFTSPVTTVLSELGANESILEIGTGEDHACLRTDAGSVYCWGRDNSGQLGSGSVGGSNVGIPKLGLVSTGAKQLAVGRYHNCVIMTDDEVKCWGLNNFGQLGQGATGNSGIPLTVTLP